MKKKHLLTVLLTICILFAFSYYYVDGTELPSVDQLTGEYTATVIKTPYSADNAPLEYTLSSEQILALQELLQSSRFTRRFTHDYSYKGPHDIYSIVLELRDTHGKQVDFIQIFFVEDLVFSISAPYARERLSLNIRYDQLDEKLDLILAGVLPSQP